MQLTSQPFLAEEERQEGWSIVQTPEVLSPCIAVVPIPPSLPPSVPLRSSFLLCRPGPINSQLIAEWHFSSSGTYTTAPPQWKWNPIAAAAAGKARGGTATAMARARDSHVPAAVAFLSVLPPPSIEAKKLPRLRAPKKLQRIKS